ncbi:MAG: carbohydrate binding domain-containing protein [Clostridia bacterium]|nr:carbohydrate binding domain-containing protein [Clostridia bacterium]
MKSKLCMLSIVSMVLAILFIAVPQQSVKAQEGIDTTSGVLVDEMFQFMNSTSPRLSGWEIYSTGGTYSATYFENFKITDTSASDNVLIKKRFVKQSSGKVTFYYRFKMPIKMDGVVWQLSSGDIPAARILTSGGNLCYENSNGTVMALQSYNADTEYAVKVVADISAGTYDVFVNGTSRVSGAAFRNPASFLNYVSINTGYTATGDLYLKPIRVHKGYNVFADFEDTMANMPGDWTSGGSGGTISVNMLKSVCLPDVFSIKLNDTSTSANKTLSKSFSQNINKVVYEYNFFIPSKVDGMTAELKSGSTTAVKLVTANGNLCYENSSGTSVSIWDGYKANVWYRMRIIADPSTDIADIYVNGKQKATGVALRNPVSGFDNLVFSTPVSAIGTMWVDDIKVYTYQPEVADYVPQPQPKASTDYYVGMQTFSAWKEGTHLGWDFTYRYPYHDLYMGTFDEEKPESEDWQLKFMSEHGVDFFLDCWFGLYMPGNPSWVDSTAPIKHPSLGHTLHDAYFYSKYSNQVKFAIADYNCRYSSSYFRNVIIPFWLEHYLKDPRYMTIDNKPVIALCDLNSLAGGGTASVKAEIDYLRQQCINAGFSGAIILTSYFGNTDKATMDKWYAQGVDYCYAYHYGGTNSIATMQNTMNTVKNSGSQLSALPVVSTGLTGEAWEYTYYRGLTSASDFQSLCNWVRDTYMPSNSTDSYASKLVLCDNWSEYGEGHWINPGTVAGFGYLDALRNTFAGGGEHTDTIPTKDQKLRINQHFSKSWVGHSWNFDSAYYDTEGWGEPNNISGIAPSGGYLNATISGGDSNIKSRNNLDIDLSNNKYIRVRYKNSTAGTAAKMYFTTTSDTAWNEAKAMSFAINANDSNYTEYVLDMSNLSGWAGTLKQLRFDPVDNAASGSVSIDFIMVTDEIPNLLNNASFETGTTSWTSYNTAISATTTPTRQHGKQSLKASNCTTQDFWIGQNLKSALHANGQGCYNISAWVRSALGNKNASVSLAINSGGTWKEFPITGQMNDSGWTKVSGVVNLSWTSLDDVVFIVRNATDTTDYYVDNCSVIKAANLLVNPSFENGINSWITYSRSISTQTSPSPANGSFVLKTTNCTSDNSWVAQDITNYLKLSGKGTYNIAAWLRSYSGSKSANIAIALKYDDTWHEVSISPQMNDSDWSFAAGTVNITWTTLQEAKFLIRNTTDRSDFYIDDCVLTRVY